jgi:hypothetical protein
MLRVLPSVFDEGKEAHYWLYSQVLTACLADDRRCVDRHQMTIGDAWRGAKLYLLPQPKHDYTYYISKPVVLNGYRQVESASNCYSGSTDQAYRDLVLRA